MKRWINSRSFRRKDIDALKLLLPYYKRYANRFALGLLAMLVATGLSRLVPWILKLAVDSIADETQETNLVYYVGAMIGIAAVSTVFVFAKRWIIRSTSRTIEFDLRARLFGHLNTLDSSYFETKKTGDLMVHFTNDIKAIGMVAGPGMASTLTTFAMLGMSLGAMIAISPTLTLLAITPYPVISITAFFHGRSLYRKQRKVQDLFGEISSRTQEDIGGVRVLRAYRQEEIGKARFEKINNDYLEANLDVAKARGRFTAWMSVLAGAGLAIALLVGGNKVITGELSLGSLVGFSAYLAELTWPVIAVGWIISLIQRGASAAGRLNGVLEASPTIVSGPLKDEPDPTLKFNNVSFRYKGATEDSLKDVSFDLESGKTLGIVGRTGSGKSTLLKLAQRFFDPTSGTIQLGDVDVKNRDLSTVRSAFGYAPQDTLIFSRSIADNIAYSFEQATDDEIANVVSQVRLKQELDEFPEGLETVVGDRGITLSGGQRQRVSLARALLSNPKLLLLDGALSSVDTETEREILTNLRAFMKDRTSIIASHRISAVRDADWIIVLERGKIVDQGLHDDLITGQGPYAKLHKLQQLALEIERAI